MAIIIKEVITIRTIASFHARYFFAIAVGKLISWGSRIHVLVVQIMIAREICSLHGSNGVKKRVSILVTF